MGEIDPLGTRRDGLDAFLDNKVDEGYVIETRTDTHAIISQRPKGLKRFTSGADPGRSWLKSTKMESRRCVRRNRDAHESDNRTVRRDELTASLRRRRARDDYDAS